METETDPAPVGRLARKAQRQKEALARLEKVLARTKRRLRDTAQNAEFATLMITESLQAWGQGRETEALLILEEGRTVLRVGQSVESAKSALAMARKRDHALLTLRAKVSELHRALTSAKAALRDWHGQDAETWARYQDSPVMRETNRALGE